MKELELFLKIKDQENIPKKKNNYFKAQIQVNNTSMKNTSIGHEVSFMTGKNRTKFTAIVLNDVEVPLRSLSWFFANFGNKLPPVKILYVKTRKYNFAKYAAMLYLVSEYDWPVKIDQQERQRFYKSIGYQKKYNGLFIGYLLGYHMDDIMAWAINNKTLKDLSKYKTICEKFKKIIELVDTSDYLEKISKELQSKSPNVIKEDGLL